jgi:hypothetical protein
MLIGLLIQLEEAVDAVAVVALIAPVIAAECQKDVADVNLVDALFVK